MIINILLLVSGFLLLIKGADWMVAGSSDLAKKNNISDLVIGLTIVAFGTSVPELLVNVVASLNNQPDLIFGNVIGSNIFNLFVILGIVGLIYPIKVQPNMVWNEIPISFLAIVVLFILANVSFYSEGTMLSRIDGSILLLFFCLFLFYLSKQAKRQTSENVNSQVYSSTRKIWVFIILGLISLFTGGILVVNNAIGIATKIGISEKIIGLTIIAAGTSLPELVTSVVAALKKNSDVAIGNIVGSNIFNIFMILSFSSLVTPVPYNSNFNLDLYLLGGGTIFLFAAMFMSGKKKLDRWEAGVLLSAYVIYTAFLIGKGG